MKVRVPSLLLRVAFFVLAVANAAFGQPSTAPAEDGRTLFGAGDYRGAEAAFTRELNGPGATPAIYLHRGLARYNQHKWAEAKHDFDVYLTVGPKNRAALVLRATASFHLGELQAAANDAAAALALDSGDAEARLIRARAQAALGHDDAAFSDFTELLARAPQNSAAFLGRGDLHARRNDLPAAIIDYARAVEISPGDPDARLKLGTAQFRQLEFAAALRSLADARPLASHTAAVQRTTGLVQFAQGDFAAAADSFSQAIARDPARANYARLMHRLSQQRLGLTDPVALTLHAPTPWEGSLSAFLLGETSEDDLFLAAQNLTPAEARAGRLCEAHFFAGALHVVRGDHRSARHAFEEAIATDVPQFAEHTLSRAELQRLPAPVEPPPRPRRR